MNNKEIKNIHKEVNSFIKGNDNGFPITPQNIINFCDKVQKIVEKHDYNLVDFRKPEFSQKTGNHNIICFIEKDELDTLADYDRGYFNEPERKSSGKTKLLFAIPYHHTAVN